MSKDKTQDRDRPAAGTAATTLPQGSLGAWLRTQREARGVGLREIADASKISIRYLEALEHDRFEILPAPVFTRGFLREYSRVVGLDPDEVVNLYLLAAEERPELPTDETSSRQRASSTGPSAVGYGLLLLLAVVVLLGIAALIWWWAQGRTGEPPAPVPPPPAVSGAAPETATPGAQVAPAPVATGVEAAPGPLAPLPAPEPRTEAPASELSTAAASPGLALAPVPANVAPSAPASPPSAAPMRVVLEFTEDCWMEYVVDGGRRTGELRTSGEVVQLDAERSVLLTLGNVPAVRVEVDGRLFPLPVSDARVVRDLRIDRDAAARIAGSPPALP